MTHKDIIEMALKDTGKLMTPIQIIDWAKKKIPEAKEKFNSALTPEKTISAQIYVDMKKLGNASRFVKAEDSMLFGLAELKDRYGKDLAKAPSSVEKHDKVGESKKEKQMHEPLANYLYHDPFFMLHVKTIEAGKSTNMKKGMYEWEHPDMIGVRYASRMYKNAFVTMQKNAESLFELFSFELKLSLNMSDVCEKYFQAVSNSSWANYGYLVVNDLDESNTDLLIEKLAVLNDQFGIGLIKLGADLNSKELKVDAIMDNAKVLLQSKKKEINYRFLDRFMGRNNDDISKFFTAVNDQAELGIDVDPSFYDKVVTEY